MPMLYCPKCQQYQKISDPAGKSGICSECGYLIFDDDQWKVDGSIEISYLELIQHINRRLE